MLTFKYRESLLLLVGDVSILIATLWIALFFRVFEFPEWSTFKDHLFPFVPLFFLWIVVYYVAGLYDRHTLVLRSGLLKILVNAQIINGCIGVVFFYLFPVVGIAPKTIFLFFLCISFLLLCIWRLYGTILIGSQRKEKAVLIGSGDEVKELWRIVNESKHYNLEFTSFIDTTTLSTIDFDQEVIQMIYSNAITTVVVDLKSDKIAPILPKLYNLVFSKVKFIDVYRVYEDMFDRIPLSLIGYSWFLENVSSSTHIGYDFLKRFMDIVIGAFVGALSLVLYPFVALVIYFDDGGPVFIFQERVGKGNRLFKLVKFRTMSFDDSSGAKVANVVTRAGKFLRESRVDELPQLWNVLKGELSLIGPRPELPVLVAGYEKEIPYYGVRHLIKPGISGWAQIRDLDAPKRFLDVEKTRRKLSYDLYYLKNRSFILDVKIALKTLKTLLTRSGV